MNSFESRNVIQPSESITLKVYKSNWLKDKIYVGISFFYRSESIVDYDLYSLKGVSFSSATKPLNKKTYCKFEINVYANKTTVVPLEKKICLKRFVYNKN